MDNMDVQERFILTWLVVVPLTLLVLGSFFVVSPWERSFVTTFGNISSPIYDSGLHFKKPLIDSVITFDIKTQKVEVLSTSASKDLQDVKAKVAVNWSIDPAQVQEIYKTLWSENVLSPRVLEPAIEDSIKAVTSQFSAEELVTKRADVSGKINTVLADRVKQFWIRVVSINIVNFEFSESFNKSIEAKVTAEQNALAQKNLLEKVKYEAEQRIVQSKAEAEAIKIQAEAIKENWGAEYVQLQAIGKWNWQLPQYYGSQALPFIKF